MIVYIHGASATAESFTHIRQFVKKKYKQEPDILLEYNSNNGFVNNLAMMKEKLKGEKGNAKHFDFTFDKHVNIGTKGNITIE